MNDRLDNLGFVFADLNTILKLAEEEKSSLVTAIRLLQRESILDHTNPVKDNVSNQPDQDLESNVNHIPQLRGILGVNRHSVINDEASSNVDLTKEDSNEDQSVQDAIKTHESNSITTRTKQKSIYNNDNNSKLENFRKKKTVGSTKDDSIVDQPVPSKQ